MTTLDTPQPLRCTWLVAGLGNPGRLPVDLDRTEAAFLAEVHPDDPGPRCPHCDHDTGLLLALVDVARKQRAVIASLRAKVERATIGALAFAAATPCACNAQRTRAKDAEARENALAEQVATLQDALDEMTDHAAAETGRADDAEAHVTTLTAKVAKVRALADEWEQRDCLPFRPLRAAAAIRDALDGGRPAEIFEDELDTHVTESMQDPEYRAAAAAHKPEGEPR